MPHPDHPPLVASAALIERARKVDASFAGRNGVLGAGYGPADRYPVFARRAVGAHVEDVDGNRLLDLVLGFGSVVLGHADPEVTAAVAGASANGVAPTLHLESQVALAERLARLVRGAEMSAFLRSGSDCTSLAVRLCRAVTGRPLVLHWGYQGWHDWCAPRADGVLEDVRRNTLAFPYNRADVLLDRLARHAGQVACVMMMPVEIEPPAEGFLEAVREACDRHGVPLVLDEVRTGFRLALGGAQEHFGVRADLVCLSKALANGHPLSAVCGRADLMQAMASVSASSVFFRAADGFAAAHATLDKLERPGTHERLRRLGERLADGLGTAARVAGIPARPLGLPAMPFLGFETGDPAQDREAMRGFCQAMLARGVLLHPGHHWFTCLAMSDTDIDQVVGAAAQAFAEMAGA